MWASQIWLVKRSSFWKATASWRYKQWHLASSDWMANMFNYFENFSRLRLVTSLWFCKEYTKSNLKKILLNYAQASKIGNTPPSSPARAASVDMVLTLFITSHLDKELICKSKYYKKYLTNTTSLNIFISKNRSYQTSTSSFNRSHWNKHSTKKSAWQISP